MASACISSCVNDARDPRRPVRATYVNLYKWPESDAEFVRSVSSNMRHGGLHRHPRVVDSISCRQLYLRSYTFSREEDAAPEETQKCFGKVKAKKDNNVVSSGKRKRSKEKGRKRRGLRKAKLLSCSALFRFFHRLLTCSASVDVVDRK